MGGKFQVGVGPVLVVGVLQRNKSSRIDRWIDDKLIDYLFISKDWLTQLLGRAGTQARTLRQEPIFQL